MKTAFCNTLKNGQLVLIQDNHMQGYEEEVQDAPQVHVAKTEDRTQRIPLSIDVSEFNIDEGHDADSECDCDGDGGALSSCLLLIGIVSAPLP